MFGIGANLGSGRPESEGAVLSDCVIMKQVRLVKRADDLADFKLAASSALGT